jgi:hypothetical protein
MKKSLIISIGAAVLCCVAGLVSTASATDTTGTWYSYPDQTFTSSDAVTTGFAYQTAVRPPINTDGSSNWPSRRGVIPVQFGLLAAPTTTTTTTKIYDPPVWESLNQAPNVIVPGSWSYAGLSLSPGLTLNQIMDLHATYMFGTGDCQGGSLRWTLRVNVNSVNRLLHIYYGTPNGPDQGCSGLNSWSEQNLITNGITPNRFEMQGGWGVPGPVYTTYQDVLASTHNGNDIVDRAQLTLDSGWGADQIAEVSNVTVNDNTWVPKTTETTTATTVDGPYANTCTLPAAELRWAKNDATATGAVNEAQSIQPGDTGQFFRQVDCKYIYNLDVTSLHGAGTYTVWARINGVNILTPATFDLR